MRDSITGRALCMAAERTAKLYGLRCPAREDIWKIYLMNHCGNAVGTGLKISLACTFLAD